MKLNGDGKISDKKELGKGKWTGIGLGMGMELREYRRLPWGFSGQPAPAPAGTLTLDPYRFPVKTSPKTCFLDQK